jgi:acetyl-CoA carboxylase biotin carboxyl carrier protein
MDMDLSVGQLKELLEALDEGGASEFEYEDEGVRLRIAMARGAPIVTTAPVASTASAVVSAAGPAPAAAEVDDPNVAFITSPFVGTFYRAPSPGAEPFTKEGAAVKPGQTLCIVEAMKLMNEIEADFACTIEDVLIENGTSVEFGQKLFKVKKA